MCVCIVYAFVLKFLTFALKDIYPLVVKESSFRFATMSRYRARAAHYVDAANNESEIPTWFR